MTALVTRLIRSRPGLTPWSSRRCASISRVDIPRLYRARIFASNLAVLDGSYEVVGELYLDRPLDQPPAQLADRSARLEDLLCPRAGQQLVNDVVRELAADVIRRGLKDPRRGRRRRPAWLDVGGPWSAAFVSFAVVGSSS